MNNIQNSDFITRIDLLSFISKEILKSDRQRPLIVGINGVDGSGKTYFSKELENHLGKTTKRQIINVSIDDFHNPREIRYQKGENSPEGYYNDSFNLTAFRNLLLKPLHNRELKIKTKYFNHTTNNEVNELFVKVDNDTIVIVEGIFLFKKELIKYFDLKIFIDVDFKYTVSRAIERDKKKKETQEEKDQVNEKYLKRYIPGQKLYLEDIKPKKLADIVFDNTVFEKPNILKFQKTI